MSVDRESIALKTAHCTKCPKGSPSLDVADFIEHYLQAHMNFTLIKCKCGERFASLVFGCLHRCKNKQLNLDVDLNSELVGERLLAAHIALNEGMKTSMKAAFSMFEVKNKDFLKAEISKGVEAELKKRAQRKISINENYKLQPRTSISAQHLADEERQLQECYGQRFADIKGSRAVKRPRIEERKEGKLSNLLTQVKQIPALQQKLQQKGIQAPSVNGNEIQLVDTTDHSDTIYVTSHSQDETVTTVEFKRNPSNGRPPHNPSATLKHLAGRVSWLNQK